MSSSFGVFFYEYYDLKENLKKLFGREVDLARFRDSLRPISKNNSLKEVI